MDFLDTHLLLNSFYMGQNLEYAVIITAILRELFMYLFNEMSF